MVATVRSPTKAEVEVVATFLRTAEAEAELELEVDLLLLQLLSNLTLLVQLSESSAKAELVAKVEAGVNATAEGYTYRHLSHFRHICLLACGSPTVSVRSKFLANTCRRTSC